MIWGHSTLVGPVLESSKLYLPTLISNKASNSVVLRIFLLFFLFLFFGNEQLGETIATSGQEETIVIADIDYNAILCQR